MGFLDHYVKNHNLEPLPPKQVENLEKLEKVIKTKIEAQGSDFETCIKVSGPQVSDLAGRLSAEMKALKPFGWGKLFSALKFVYNIAFEVAQIVQDMSGCLVPPNTSDADREKILITAGQDLTWFVWTMVDPFDGKFKWVLFKKTIEKKLIRWLAGLGISSVLHLFRKGLSTSSVQTLGVGYIVKAV